MFDITRQILLAQVELRIPGEHNVRNALRLCLPLITYLVILSLKPPMLYPHSPVPAAEVVGEVNGITIIDDYAHHPTKIRATLAAARPLSRTPYHCSLAAPHLLSHPGFEDDFAASFADADEVIITGIYASRERTSLFHATTVTKLAVLLPDTSLTFQALHHTWRKTCNRCNDRLSAGDADRVCRDVQLLIKVEMTPQGRSVTRREP